jgi:hypothetical protein
LNLSGEERAPSVLNQLQKSLTLSERGMSGADADESRERSSTLRRAAHRLVSRSLYRAIEFLPEGGGTPGDDLPVACSLSPDVYDVEIAAAIAPVKSGLLAQEQTHDRQIVRKLASCVVPFLERLHLVCTCRIRPQILAQDAWHAALGSISYAEREISAHQTIHDLCISMHAGFGELLFELPEMFREARVYVASGRQLARRPLGKLAERSGVPGDNLPIPAALLPKIDHIEVAAEVPSFGCPFLTPDQADSREIIGEFARDDVMLLAMFACDPVQGVVHPNVRGRLLWGTSATRSAKF